MALGALTFASESHGLKLSDGLGGQGTVVTWAHSGGDLLENSGLDHVSQANTRRGRVGVWV